MTEEFTLGIQWLISIVTIQLQMNFMNTQAVLLFSSQSATLLP